MNLAARWRGLRGTLDRLLAGSRGAFQMAKRRMSVGKALIPFGEVMG